MKKKIFSLLLIFTIIFTLSGCKKDDNPTKLDSLEVRTYTLKEQEACFNFFWETQVVDESLASYGLIPDRYPSNGLASIASVGFGLAAIPIGIQNGWITYEEGYDRALKTLMYVDFLETIEGFYYHFYYEASGRPATGSEVSVIDTALFIAGAIVAGEYFGGEVEKFAYKVYDEVNWPWYVNPETNQFYMGYDPVAKEFNGAWDFYGEQLIMYFLGAGSSTYPIDYDVYKSFTKKVGAYGGQMFIHSWFGSIFTYQFSHAFIDFRGLLDNNNIDWYENSVKATKAARQYCIDNPDGYLACNENSWGFTACDTPLHEFGYSGLFGAPPSGNDNKQHQNDGTMSLAGSVGSMPFLPVEVEDSIQYYYTILQGNLVGKYGLYDSYNLELTDPWISKDVIGIDKGISLLMIENYRSNLVWKYFMQADFMPKAIEVLKFKEA